MFTVIGSDTPHANGVHGGPIGTEPYRRAVYRPAPGRFSIEMLTPIKISGSYSFGMRICPIIDDRFSTTSSSSEYEIWRRWEDCLTFQGNLESEYRRMARDKRTRLQRGKGVKRDGFYKQDAASSWESLPPGPDPSSVGREIHEYIPTLSRKGTVLRASQATIDQRAKELKAFIEALWKDDVPALIDELRNDSLVRDFFGFWRRDYEYHEKLRRQRSKNSSSRTSVTSSIFSMYFSSSNLSVQSLTQDRPVTIACSDSNSSSFQTSRQTSPAPRYRKGSTSSEDSALSHHEGRTRSYSTGSSNFSTSTPSDSSLDSPVHVNLPVPAIVDDVPTVNFDHNPQRNVHYPHERLTSALAILPEDREVCLKSNTPLINPPPIVPGKRRKSSLDPDRQGRIFLSIPDVPSSPVSEGLLIPDRSGRESWHTMDSASCVLEGLEHLTLSSQVKGRSNRESTSSVATFMTSATADGVLPRERRPSPESRRLKYKSRVVSGPVSISEVQQEWSDSDDSDDILDMFLTTGTTISYGHFICQLTYYFVDSFPMPCFDIPHIEFPEVLIDPVEECPITPSFSEVSFEQRTASNHLPIPVAVTPPTSTTKSSTFSASKSMTPIPDKFTMKVKYNDSLVVLRVSDEISYKDLRQSLFNKLTGQEGVALSTSFKITFLQPVRKDGEAAETRNSARPASSDTDDHIPYPITSAADWENVAACVEGYKLTLLISDDTF
ncbi:hypothetical protein H0H87_004747 [Tephrocybe sp. NHM501043]|nr:hypothetical protein H0H87_004747 [Tephrocybe sp. NHM501043]